MIHSTTSVSVKLPATEEALGHYQRAVEVDFLWRDYPARYVAKKPKKTNKPKEPKQTTKQNRRQVLLQVFYIVCLSETRIDLNFLGFHLSSHSCRNGFHL